MAALGAVIGAAAAHMAYLANLSPEKREQYLLDQKEEVRLAKELADREGLKGPHRDRLIDYAREVAA